MPVRTVGEQSYRIRELQLRLHYASSLFQPAPEARLRPCALSTMAKWCSLLSCLAALGDIHSLVHSGETWSCCSGPV